MKQNFKPYSLKRFHLERMEAEAINNDMGNTYRVLISTKHIDRAECERAVGAAMKGQTKVARGAYAPIKGGIIKGAKVF